MKQKMCHLLSMCVLVMSMVSSVSAQAQDNQSQITRILDTQEITNIVNTFTIYLDEAEIGQYANTFADGGRFKIQNEKGKITLDLEKNKLEAFFGPRFKAFKDAGQQRRHFFTNVSIVEQTKTNATIKLNALLTSTQEGTLSFITTMTYDIRLTKTKDGSWKFTEVISKLDRSLDAKVD